MTASVYSANALTKSFEGSKDGSVQSQRCAEDASFTSPLSAPDERLLKVARGTLLGGEKTLSCRSSSFFFLRADSNLNPIRSEALEP